MTVESFWEETGPNSEDLTEVELESTHTRIGRCITDAASGVAYGDFTPAYDEPTNTATWTHVSGGVTNETGGATVTASQHNGVSTFTIAKRSPVQGEGYQTYTKELVLAGTEGRVTTSTASDYGQLFGRLSRKTEEPPVTKVFDRKAYDATLNDLIDFKTQARFERARRPRRRFLRSLLGASLATDA
jgi:hypothetical protein